MTRIPRNKSKPEPSVTRTNRDRAMIVLGIALITLFLAAGYMSLSAGDRKTAPTLRGPVKDPKHLSLKLNQLPPVAVREALVQVNTCAGTVSD
jgi:hypothetical protein